MAAALTDFIYPFYSVDSGTTYIRKSLKRRSGMKALVAVTAAIAACTTFTPYLPSVRMGASYGVYKPISESQKSAKYRAKPN